MRTSHLGIVLFAFGALGASSAFGSVVPADKLRPSPVASALPTFEQRGPLGTLDARALNQFSETKLIAFDGEKKKPPPPPPERSEKCPPRDDGKGGDGKGGNGNGFYGSGGNGNDGHDCRGDKGGGE